MGREIKFRAWDKNEGKMIEPVEFVRLLKQVSNRNDNSTGGDAIRRHELEWMQYTHLKDKNGKEIYEGDILRWQSEDGDSSELYEVLYREAAFVTRLIGRKVIPEFSHLNGRMVEDMLTSEVDVVGNIYENSDLVKEDRG